MTKMIDKLAMVRLDISIWSARARLNASDLKDTSVLPPSAMVSLGTKRLFDPTKLRVFGALKQQAIRTLDCYGTRFLGGWATDVNKLAEIEPKLVEIGGKFHNSVQDFFAGYDAGINEWVAKFPAYESVLRHAVPTKGQLQKKFSFDWQTFQISPVGDDAFLHNNTKDAISNLNTDALNDVADIIAGIYERSFKDKTTVQKVAFNQFGALSTKLKSLAFIYPYFNDLDNLLSGIVAGYSTKHNDPAFIETFKRLIASISTADGLTKLIEPFAKSGKSQEDILNDMAMLDVQASQAVDDSAETKQENEPLIDSLLAAGEEALADAVRSASNNVVDAKIQSEETLDSGGLW